LLTSLHVFNITSGKSGTRMQVRALFPSLLQIFSDPSI